MKISGTHKWMDVLLYLFFSFNKIKNCPHIILHNLVDPHRNNLLIRIEAVLLDVCTILYSIE